MPCAEERAEEGFHKAMHEAFNAGIDKAIEIVKELYPHYELTDRLENAKK